MNLPISFKDKIEWLIIGPMGPSLPSELSGQFSSLPVLAVDGGAHFCQKIDIWVGDADSFTKEVEAEAIFKFPSSKDLSDLALSLKTLEHKSTLTLHLWGFYGGRMDHFLFNLGEVHQFLKNKIKSKIFIYDPFGKMVFSFYTRGDWNIHHNGSFSLGAIDQASISLKGECNYTLENKKLFLPLSSQGLSNYAQGNLVISSDETFFLYFKDGKN